MAEKVEKAEKAEKVPAEAKPTVKSVLATFLNADWYTNSQGGQECVFTLTEEQLKAYRLLLKG